MCMKSWDVMLLYPEWSQWVLCFDCLQNIVGMLWTMKKVWWMACIMACISTGGVVTRLPMVSRPDYGVVFAPLGTNQNAGSFWTMYFTLGTLPKDIIPEQAWVNIARVEACGVPGVNNTTLAMKQAAETVAQICTVLRRYEE